MATLKSIKNPLFLKLLLDVEQVRVYSIINIFRLNFYFDQEKSRQWSIEQPFLAFICEKYCVVYTVCI